MFDRTEWLKLKYGSPTYDSTPLSDFFGSRVHLAKGNDASGTTLMGMRMGMDELKKSDPAKAQAIEPDVAEILKLSQAQGNAKAIQAKAQAALQKMEPQT